MLQRRAKRENKQRVLSAPAHGACARSAHSDVVKMSIKQKLIKRLQLHLAALSTEGPFTAHRGLRCGSDTALCFERLKRCGLCSPRCSDCTTACGDENHAQGPST
ncbi:hypothetical protein EVAR_102096_1 [Eumeta japonica]|uniref:Uncharacterized protein n=1 Tax=Eumeta variegata TaxID=151549 RepID=A0A4C1U025_EUMVA|nr:hypothetical protein EVAR_102096_1 [Eumeta japonica]